MIYTQNLFLSKYVYKMVLQVLFPKGLFRGNKSRYFPEVFLLDIFLALHPPNKWHRHKQQTPDIGAHPMRHRDIHGRHLAAKAQRIIQMDNHMRMPGRAENTIRNH